MEILKHGENFLKERCRYCGCEFIYNKKDEVIRDKYGDYYVQCPECDKTIFLGVKL